MPDRDEIQEIIHKLIRREEEARKNGRIEEADSLKTEIDDLFGKLHPPQQTESRRYEPRELLDCLPQLEAYLTSYVLFAESSHALPIALWIMMTHVASVFDALPFLVLNSTTKRSGKTHLQHMLSFTCSCAWGPIKHITAPALYEIITSEKAAMGIQLATATGNEVQTDFVETLGMPTILLDEAEFLSKLTSKEPMRPLLNVYERSTTQVLRFGKKKYDVYCPKAFALIGDVHDTLRDRCIVITLRRKMRAKTKREWNKREAETDGQQLRQKISGIEQDTQRVAELLDIYHATRLKFLNDRDEDLWRPLFALCKWLYPERIPELERVAADLSAAKTAPARKHGELHSIEKEFEEQEYGERLLLDMVAVIGDRKQATTQELLTGLRELRTAPWRTYKGTGLSEQSIGRLLKRFGVGPRTVRVKPEGEQGSTKKGYRKDDLLRAAESIGGDDRKSA